MICSDVYGEKIQVLGDTVSGDIYFLKNWENIKCFFCKTFSIRQMITLILSVILLDVIFILCPLAYNNQLFQRCLGCDSEDKTNPDFNSKFPGSGDGKGKGNMEKLSIKPMDHCYYICNSLSGSGCKVGELRHIRNIFF